jgi:predicted 2-oxoglutarate/Fe(II)-dependent dioxygenase YbiX
MTNFDPGKLSFREAQLNCNASTQSVTGLTTFRVWDGVISRAQCARTISAMNRAAIASGAVLRRGTNYLDVRMRTCTEHRVPQTESKYVIDALRTVANQALSLRNLGRARLDGPKFCSYPRGGFFRAHRDISSDIADPMEVRTRVMSLVCLLNDEDSLDDLPVFDGGALVLHIPRVDGTVVPTNVPLSAGSVVAFSSDLFHEVRPVRSGVRCSAVAWLYEMNHLQENADEQSSL